MIATAEGVVLSKAKGTLGYSFTFPCHLDFLKKRTHIDFCLCTPLHSKDIWPHRPLLPDLTREAVLSSGERGDMAGKGSQREGTLQCELSDIREGVYPLCHHHGKSFSQILLSNKGYKCVMYFFLSGAGPVRVWCIKSLSHRSCV